MGVKTGAVFRDGEGRRAGTVIPLKDVTGRRQIKQTPTPAPAPPGSGPMRMTGPMK